MEIPAELRVQYRAQRSGVEDSLLGMGSTVLELLAEATAALDGRDAERAGAVQRADERLDAESRVLQDQILRMLALQAPVASELRLMALYLFANLHLERMSDLCANIARAAADAQPQVDPQVRAQVAEMAQHAHRVVETMLQALARRDVELARSLPTLDDPLDTLNRSIFRRTAELVAAEGEFDWAMRLILVARYIERLADHAVDIGEQVIYAVTGELERLG
jgi:phosphate transport system protein